MDAWGRVVERITDRVRKARNALTLRAVSAPMALCNANRIREL